MSEPLWTPLNLNSKVRVKLTSDGRARLIARDDKFFEETGVRLSHSIPTEDKEGWSEWQLWSLMAELGPHIHMSGPMMFDANMLFPIGAD